MPMAPKRSSVPAKKKTLDDYLKAGKRPPTRGSRNMPPDYDVMTPDMGYTMPTDKKQPKKITKSTPDKRNAGLTAKQIKENNLRKLSKKN